MAGRQGLVWLASYPKSGNTWFRVILANLAIGPGRAATINEAPGYSEFAASRGRFETAAMLESALLSDDDIDALRPGMFDDVAQDSACPTWIKVHDAFTRLPDGRPMLGTSARAAIYLIRDPRDVAISLAHFSSLSIDDAITRLNSTHATLSVDRLGAAPQLRQTLLDWSGHADSWLGQTSVPVLTIRYEDLKTRPAAEVARALAFAGQEAAPSDVERAVANAAFEELQRQEAEKGFIEQAPGVAPFFRAGRAGAWREILSPEQRARIEDAHGLMMDRFGYARA